MRIGMKLLDLQNIVGAAGFVTGEVKADDIERAFYLSQVSLCIYVYICMHKYVYDAYIRINMCILSITHAYTHFHEHIYIYIYIYLYMYTTINEPLFTRILKM